MKRGKKIKNLKELLHKKIHSKCGESIGETLAALLIAALALTMLAGAISSSFSMITKSKKKLNDYYDGTETMVSASTSQGIVRITDESDNPLLQYDIEYGVNREFDNTPVVVYRYLTPTPTPISGP